MVSSLCTALMWTVCLVCEVALWLQGEAASWFMVLMPLSILVVREWYYLFKEWA